MNKILSAILPTKGRGEQARVCIDRLIETTRPYQLEIIVLAYPDETNIKAFEFDENWNNNTMPWYDLPRDIVPIGVNIFGHDLSVSIFATKRNLMDCYNFGASISGGTHLFDFDDDAWFENGWLDKVYEVFDKISNGHGYVKIKSDNKCDWAERAVGNREFYKDVLGGVISIPHYWSQYNDVEKSIRAKKAGLFFESDAYIEHRSWVHSKAKMDETYLNGGIKHYNEDRVTFLTREAKGFPNDYKGVI